MMLTILLSSAKFLNIRIAERSFVIKGGLDFFQDLFVVANNRRPFQLRMAYAQGRLINKGSLKSNNSGKQVRQRWLHETQVCATEHTVLIEII